MKDKVWPITQWVNNQNKPMFQVEDDQGYNFSFPSRKEAEDFRFACSEFNRIMDERETEIVRKYRRSLRS